MKIISKFTDFYEYDCYRYGEPDQSLVWERHTIDDSYSRNDELTKYIRDTYCLSSNAMLPDRFGRCNNGYPSIEVDEHIIGIYPYVYWLPRIIYAESRFKKTKFSIEDSLICLKEKDFYKEIFKDKGINPDRVTNIKQIVSAGKDIQSYKGTGRKINDPIITEDKNIFDTLHNPVFYIRFDEDYRYGYYNGMYVRLNPCLLETPLLELYPDISSERDIYTDIENFLWTQKQEPMSVPDNKTKITSHGFDLKTSFRKM